MTRQNLLPIFRRYMAWITLAAAILLLFISAAWMDKTVADNHAEIDRVYEEMDVHFLLNAGRRSLSPGFSITLNKLRRIQRMEYFEDFGCSDLYISVQMDPSRFGETMAICWTCDPQAAGIHAVKGELGEGIWLPGEIAEKYGVEAGDELTVYASSLSIGSGMRSKEVPVAAVTDAAVAYMPEESFDDMFDWLYTTYVPEFSMMDMHFSLKKEYNPMMSEVEQKLQALLNTPNPYDRNRDITVNYNASEIDGMIKPLEKSIASAEFFSRLFRTVLPSVAYMIEILAVLGLRNEIGVRRLLGDDRAAVFFGIWLPVFALCLPGYLCSSVFLLFTALRTYAPWAMMFRHLAGTTALTAAVTGILCATRPLDLLREKENE